MFEQFKPRPDRFQRQARGIMSLMKCVKAVFFMLPHVCTGFHTVRDQLQSLQLCRLGDSEIDNVMALPLTISSFATGPLVTSL